MADPDLKTLTLEALADLIGQVEPGSRGAARYHAEINRRLTAAQLEAASAQMRAATAAEETTISTEKNARYLKYSVVVLVISSVATLLVSFANLIVAINQVRQ